MTVRSTLCFVAALGFALVATANTASAQTYPEKILAAIDQTPRPTVSIPGEASIRFSINRDGSLQDIEVANSSGSTALDVAAVAFIKAAAPFPAPGDADQTKFIIDVSSQSNRSNAAPLNDPASVNRGR